MFHKNNQIKKHIGKKIKYIALISDINEENNLLYNLMKKYNYNCAYLTSHVLCYRNKKVYFNNKYLNITLLENIIIELDKENISHLIINFPIKEESIFTGLKFDAIIIYNNLYKLKKKVKIIRKLSKSYETTIITDDKNSKYFRKQKKIISYGKQGNYKITDSYIKKDLYIINLEYQYNKYTLKLLTQNEKIFRDYILSIIYLNSLDIDILKIINFINKHQKRTK